MLYQEDIMRYFYQISSDLREENIPVFNNIIFNYPGFPKKEDIIVILIIKIRSNLTVSLHLDRYWEIFVQNQR